MRWRWLWLVAWLCSCDYRASLHDCFVACAQDSACPSGMSCAGGFCRAPGATGSCEAVIGDAHLADSPGRADAAVSDATSTDAATDASLGPPIYYGCFTVADDSTTCSALCASEGHVCSTACNGDVWYAYSLSGPCTQGGTTKYSGTACNEAAVIGTGHTIYVQCCCR